MRVRPLVFAVLVVAVFLAPVAIAGSAGLWATTGQQGAGAGGGNGGGGEGGGGSGGSGGAEGGNGSEGGVGGGGGRAVVPGDARGWMTLAQISEANAIPLPEILEAFDLPSDTDPATALRDLESEMLSVAALRAWLAERAAP